MFDELREQLSEDIVQLNEPMQNHTTFKIGGPADIMICPHTVEEIKLILSLLFHPSTALYGSGYGQQSAGKR